MGEQDIFERISSRYFELTASERRAADYILAHRGEVQDRSISELAEACDVAEATLSRFCRRLGLKGYNAFRLELARSDAACGGDGGAGEAGCGTVCRRRLQENLDALEQTARLADPETVRRGAELLMGARRVACMGLGHSMVMAAEAWTLFSTILPQITFIPDPHLQLSTLALMEEGDAVLFFSYSGSSGELPQALDLARERGVKVLLITRFPASPGGRRADLVLQCGSREGPLQAGSVEARIAQLFVMDLLFTEICRLDPEGTAARQERVAEALARKHL